jgi:hypothetical protein
MGKKKNSIKVDLFGFSLKVDVDEVGRNIDNYKNRKNGIIDMEEDKQLKLVDYEDVFDDSDEEDEDSEDEY